MILLLLATASLVCAAVPATLFVANLRLYREPAAAADPSTLPAISVLIPARDEEQSIAAAVESALQSRGVTLEVVVMDDASTDKTAEIVTKLAAQNTRVRLAQAPPLPPGWNGKQHACWALAHEARYPVLCFVDADVRLSPEALTRMATFLGESGATLVSGFPRQVTETTMEWLLLPLIHFVLLGFLPIRRMRSGTNPGFAAGCGQFLMVERDPYFRAGGHAAIRETMHDGLRLPRLFRQAGERTDLADLTHLAACRMYTTGNQVWQGLAKNATEGLAAPARIVPITLVLLLGQVIPYVLLLGLLLTSKHGQTAALVLAAVACLAAVLPRLLATVRFRQPARSMVLHPVGILALLAIQWFALARKLRGGTVSWRSRAYIGSRSSRSADRS